MINQIKLENYHKLKMICLCRKVNPDIGKVTIDGYGIVTGYNQKAFGLDKLTPVVHSHWFELVVYQFPLIMCKNPLEISLECLEKYKKENINPIDTLYEYLYQT